MVAALAEPARPAPPATGHAHWGLVAAGIVTLLSIAGVAAWVANGPIVNHWLAVHTGLSNLSGSWYGFWSGFGSDLAEFGVIGAVGTGAYQLVRKYNCHEPGCWRVGTHPAAGGQFLVCYRHHPDFNGEKPTHEMIFRLHEEHLRRQDAIHHSLHELQQKLEGPVTNGAERSGGS
jgi:hypothetical protein